MSSTDKPVRLSIILSKETGRSPSERGVGGHTKCGSSTRSFTILYSPGIGPPDMASRYEALRASREPSDAILLAIAWRVPKDSILLAIGRGVATRAPSPNGWRVMAPMEAADAGGDGGGDGDGDGGDGGGRDGDGGGGGGSSDGDGDGGDGDGGGRDGDGGDGDGGSSDGDGGDGDGGDGGGDGGDGGRDETSARSSEVP